MSGKADVFIVGGGFSGIALASGLLDRHPGLRVVLSQRSDGPAFGLAYETACPIHLLNVPAKSMSAFADRPNDFLDWAHSSGIPLQSGDFAPRMMYRQYLSSIRERCILRGLEVSALETVGVTRASAGWRCWLANGSSLEAARVVLAFGGFPRSTVPELFDVHNHEAFVSNPWSGASPPLQSPDASVGLIGSGLTAVDTVLAYEDSGFKGKYTMLSRRGLLPRRHDFTFAPLPDDQVPKPRRSIRSLVKEVRHASARAEEEGTNWRVVFDAMRPHVSNYWQALSVEDRGRFLRHVRPFWEVHRHRMAPQIAALTDRLVEAGRLEVRAVRLLGADPDNGRLNVSVRAARTGVEVLRFDRVVNCTGPANRVMALPSPLLHQLLADGIVQTDRYQLGLFSDDHGRLLSADGAVQDGLYVLGLLRRGQVWESTAVPELRVQAAALSALFASSA